MFLAKIPNFHLFLEFLLLVPRAFLYTCFRILSDNSNISIGVFFPTRVEIFLVLCMLNNFGLFPRHSEIYYKTLGVADILWMLILFEQITNLTVTWAINSSQSSVAAVSMSIPFLKLYSDIRISCVWDTEWLGWPGNSVVVYLFVQLSVFGMKFRIRSSHV